MGLLGDIFLRLIKSIIAPLLFGTLVSGIASTGSVKTMGRIGGKAILYFEIVTTIALFVGLGAVNFVKPGVGVQLQKAGVGAVVPQTNSGLAADPGAHVSGKHHRLDGARRGAADRRFLFPVRNGLRGHRLQGAAGGGVCESLAEVMFQYTNYVMFVAPFGVFGAMAATVGRKGTARSW